MNIFELASVDINPVFLVDKPVGSSLSKEYALVLIIENSTKFRNLILR